MTPEEFTAEVRRIASNSQGHAAHRAFDALSNRILSDLGYSEGVNVFQEAIHDWHSDEAPYPRPPRFNWRCLFGRHEWVVPDGGYVWSATCNRCGRKESSGNPCP